MSNRRRFSEVVLCASMFLAPFAAHAVDASPDAAVIEQAITTLLGRPVPSAGPRDTAVFEAGRTLRLAGSEGAAALKRAIVSLPETPDETDADRIGYFRINAANLLFQISGLDEAETVAEQCKVAGDSRRFAPQLVFGTAFQAARMNDPRAYPMLIALLDDVQDNVRLTRASEPLLDWPDAHVLLWAAAGEDAEPALLAALDDPSASAEALASAAWVAAKSANVQALPALRRLAAREEFDIARGAALEALGVFGHPDDFDFLRRELAAAVLLPADDDFRPARIVSCVNALGQFGDLRAAEDLLPLVLGRDPGVRQHMRGLIVYLLTPDGLAAMRASVADLTGVERANAEAGVARIFAMLGIPAGDYDEAEDDVKAEVIEAFRAALQERYEPQASDPEEWTNMPLEELLAAVVEQRTTALSDGYEWAAPRHFLQNAVPADRPKFLAVRRALAESASGRVVADLDVLSAILTRLVRAGYREPVGYGERVEAK